MPRALLIAVLCLGFTPGLGELLSDGLHAATEGHSPHADCHEAPGPEHGCTGWQHNCSCHSSQRVALSDLGTAIAPATAQALQRPRGPRGMGPAGTRSSLERPPRA